MMSKILVVDDDPFIRQLVKLALRNDGLRVIESAHGMEALELLERTKVDMVILDIMMPVMDGWELCSELRRRFPELPLLMVTAKGETAHKIRGFQLGTDDYIVKPFDPMELTLRCKALLKRYNLQYSQRITLGNMEINRTSFEVLLHGESIRLPLKEFELLCKFAGHPNQVFTRNQLLEQIWGMDFDGDERTVDVHIRRLRERFPEQASGFVITTIRGLGYKMEVYP